MVERPVFRVFASALLGLFVIAAAPGGLRAQEDPGFVNLAYLLETDPDGALDRISETLDALEASDRADPRVVFDLYRLAADLLIEGGQVKQAAQIIARLASYAVQFRDTLEIDPVPLFARAAALLEDTGQLHEARDVLVQMVEEQRAGAQPDEVIAATMHDLARVSEALGQPLPEAVLAPETGARGDEGGFRAVDVYYATDRARTGDARPSEFYGAERGDLDLGVATVTVPEIHTPGVVEAPSIWRLEFRANPARHVVLQSVEPLDRDSFYGRLQAEFREVPDREAFVFIHGYNTRFDQAARRAAQIAYDMTYTGVPILYSWPSRGSTVGYVADTAVVRLSGRRLSRFLEDLVAHSGAETIHVVAHSMGNRALTDALELMALRMGVHEGDPPVLGQVLFAAPDVDAGLFQEMLPTIRPIARRLTLYASEQDWALAASRKLHGNALRAGMGGEFTLTNPAVDSIDMSELGEDMLAHNYFADDSSALADMMTLFWQNTDPASRCGLVAAPDGAGMPAVWHYTAGQCAERNLIDVLAHLRREHVQSLDEARAVLIRTVADVALLSTLEPVVAKIVGD